MRAVIQRVKSASVSVNGKIAGKIGTGLLVLLAIHRHDDERIAKKTADKIINLRIFGDAWGKMNHSLKEVNGEMLIISQFTLYGDCRKGNRPGFTESATPDIAIPIYEKFVLYVRGRGIRTETGEFGAKMEVALINEGPVTLITEFNA